MVVCTIDIVSVFELHQKLFWWDRIIYLQLVCEIREQHHRFPSIPFVCRRRRRSRREKCLVLSFGIKLYKFLHNVHHPSMFFLYTSNIGNVRTFSVPLFI